MVHRKLCIQMDHIPLFRNLSEQNTDDLQKKQIRDLEKQNKRLRNFGMFRAPYVSHHNKE